MSPFSVTTTTQVTALELPAPFDAASIGAGIEYHRRKVSWSVTGPGNLARNRYARAWIEITERELWRGEPLWLYASRRSTDSSTREPFTNAGRQALHDQLVPLVARYGFDRLWTETHAAPYSATDGQAGAAAARREAEWWDTLADLADMHHHGQLSFRALDLADGHRPTELVAYDGPYGRRHHDDVIAEAVHDGHHVGWLTQEGRLIPDGTILETPAPPTRRRP